MTFLALASPMVFVAAAMIAAAPGDEAPLRVEAEQAHLEGLKIALPVTSARNDARDQADPHQTDPQGSPIVPAEGVGYSGAGYVTGFDADTDQLSATIEVPQTGVYDVYLGYRSPSGEKGIDLVIGDAPISTHLPASKTFARHKAGKIELAGGPQDLTVHKGWGYYDLDYIELVPSMPLPPPVKPPATLADPHATPQARALMQFLVDHYGEVTLSGQINADEAQYVHELTGKWPLIFGADLMDYSPSRVAHGADATGLVENVIERARDGHLVTLSWHWNAPTDLIDGEYVNDQGETVKAPWYSGFYTYATTFDVEAALADKDSPEYQAIVRDIDAIAVQLRKIADAGIPVLWRPLHEAPGGWFWWGAKGPEPFKELWRLTFNRLTGYHGLHNLIWVWTGQNPDWYPGDDYVDIIGVDAYPKSTGDPLTGTWEALQKHFGGRKLVTLSEFGGVPDVEKMHRLGVWFSYFLPWSGRLGPRGTPEEDVRATYGAPKVIARDEIAIGGVYGLAPTP